MSANYDCFGVNIREDGGSFVLVSGASGKPYAVLDAEGLHVTKKRGREKEENVISLRALKTMIRQVEAAQK